MLPRIGLTLGLLATAAVARADGPHAGGVHLSWVRGTGAAGCPDAAAIQADVARRLEQDPFSRAPTQFIEAIVEREGGAWRAVMAMRAPGGQSLGSRTLASTDRDCGAISTAAALAIAIMIDPEVLVRSPSETAPRPAPRPSAATAAAAPAPPPEPRPDASSTRQPVARGGVAARLLGGAGVLPSFALGASLTAAVNVSRRVSVWAGVAFFPEVHADPPHQGIAFGLTWGELRGCYAPVDARLVQLRLCGGGIAGVLHAVVFFPEATHPGQRGYYALSQSAEVDVAVWHRVSLGVGVSAVETVSRHAFLVEEPPAGMETVFTQPVVAAVGWASLGFRF